MKIIHHVFVLICLLNANLLYASTYYFSSSIGLDSNTALQAKNQATPWQTISKLNTIMSILQPGDSVLFKRGDSFPGSITIGASGIAGHPISFGAYGSGSIKPVLDNRLALTGWTNLGSNIWEVSSSNLNGQPTALMINEILQPLGRFPNIDAPNRGYLTVSSHPSGSKTEFTDNTLLATPDWTGAEAVVRTSHWTLDRRIVANHSSQTITLGTNTGYEIVDKFGYFFQNHPAALDKEGEWCYLDLGKKILLYSNTDPNTKVIRVANTNKYFEINTKSHLVIDGFKMLGAKQFGINLTKSTFCVIKNCEFVACGANALNIGNYGASDNDSISIVNNSFLLTQSSCINANGKRLAFIGNTIKNTATVPGMAMTNCGSLGIHVIGVGITIERNTIDSTGYIPILFHGSDILIKENFINYYCTVLDDGGAIYTQLAYKPEETNRKIINNVIINGVGATEGTNGTYAPAEGIYIDDITSNIEISGNTVAFCTNAGIYLHNARKINVKNNTLFGCGTAMLLNHDNIAPAYPVIDCDIQSNLLVNNSINPAKSLLIYQNLDETTFGKLGTLDNNIYCQPFLKSNYLKYQITSISPQILLFLNLAEWQTFSGYDLHSVPSPRNFNLFNKTLSDNGVYNGKFESNTADWSLWNPEFNTSSISRETGQLDGGCLAFTVTGTGTENSSRISTAISSIIAGKSYLLKFGVKATVDGSIKCVISPASFNVKTSATRLDHEILFTANATQGMPSLFIYAGPEDGTVYLDNIALYEVEISNTNDYIRFEYNKTAVARIISADKNYITPAGISYGSGSSISIPPFSSVVLLKADIILGIELEEKTKPQLFKLYPNPAFDKVYITSETVIAPSIATLYDLSGRVILQQLIRQGAPFDIGLIPKGIYAVRISGNKQTQTLKLIKR